VLCVGDSDSLLTVLTADGSIQLAVMSSHVARALAENVFLSSSIITRAIAELTKQFGWNCITIVADLDDSYFLHAAEELYRIADTSSISGSRFIQLRDSDTAIENFLSDQVERLNLRIIALSLRPHLASKLLCRARQRHLVWPEYAWIASISTPASSYQHTSILKFPHPISENIDRRKWKSNIYSTLSSIGRDGL
jgi:hypothetical protein